MCPSMVMSIFTTVFVTAVYINYNSVFVHFVTSYNSENVHVTDVSDYQCIDYHLYPHLSTHFSILPSFTKLNFLFII